MGEQIVHGLSLTRAARESKGLVHWWRLQARRASPPCRCAGSRGRGLHDADQGSHEHGTHLDHSNPDSGCLQCVSPCSDRAVSVSGVQWGSCHRGREVPRREVAVALRAGHEEVMFCGASARPLVAGWPPSSATEASGGLCGSGVLRPLFESHFNRNAAGPTGRGARTSTRVSRAVTPRAGRTVLLSS